MKGIIFNFFEEFVCQKFGPNAFDELTESCVLKTKEPFVGPGTYPDEDMLELVGVFCRSKNIPATQALSLFGAFCFPKLAAAMPGFVDRYSHPKPFLCSVESIIHSEVRKLYPDSRTPVFDICDTGTKKLQMTYRSSRKLCHFVEGLFEGVGDYFQNKLTYSQSKCCHTNDTLDHCVFDIDFEKAEA